MVLPSQSRSIRGLSALTGDDLEVVAYFEREPLVGRFIESAMAMLDVALSGCGSGSFEHVTVAFGCTGARHRSVYCAGMVRRGREERGQQVTRRHCALEG